MRALPLMKGRAVTIRVGDSVFIRTGVPATVQKRDDTSGKLELEVDPEKVRQDTRHGYLNGLNPETRQELYGILDEVKANTKDPVERIESLRSKLAEIEHDPKQLQLANYLRAEMAHIMNSHGMHPREYSIHESKVR